MQSHCPEVNRGDVSSLVSAFSKFLMPMLTDMLIPPVYGVSRDKKLLIMADFSFTSADPKNLLFTQKMAQLFNQESFASETLSSVRKRLLAFLSAIFSPKMIIGLLIG